MANIHNSYAAFLIFACTASLIASAAPAVKEGKFTCRDSKNRTAVLKVEQIPSEPDKIRVDWNGRKQILQSEPTTTGALRYEELGSKLVYIQVPDHSLLLDDKTMHPILTDCTQG